ncbi:MAG: histidinol-phosphatase [bacterium]|nr:histidinol-phosphatase [bacterium]
MASKTGNYYYYTGAIHMHTTESDGTKPFEEVVRIGCEAGLDFMMVTDHMTLVHRDQGKEGIYDKTLVVVGYEHNDLDDHHHYLLFESPKVYPENMTAKEYVAAGAADGALGIMAHPDEIRDRLKEYPPYPWDDWSVEGFTGLELWNQMSEWMEKLTRFNKLAMSLSPRKSMVGPTDRILKRWDDLNLQRRVVGIAGVDAHAFPIKIGPITIEIFPYKVHFRCLRSYIMLDKPMSSDFETARKQLYDAIRNCRLFCANIRWGEADSFEFRASNGSTTGTCGDEIGLTKETMIQAKVPARATLKLIKNGCLCFSVESDNLEYAVTEPGVYRIEAWRGKRGWIFSNHIRIV